MDEETYGIIRQFVEVTNINKEVMCEEDTRIQIYTGQYAQRAKELSF